jgi:hypothetical protein
MVDTLKIAEGLQEGEDDDKRLRDLEVKVNVQAILTGLMLAAMVALFWQLLALRGEVSAGLARLDERLASSARPSSGSTPWSGSFRRLDAGAVAPNAQEETEMPTPAINDSVVAGARKFLEALNASGGTPIERLSPKDARQVLVDAQNSVRVDLSGVERSERTIDADGQPLRLHDLKRGRQVQPDRSFIADLSES